MSDVDQTSTIGGALLWSGVFFLLAGAILLLLAALPPLVGQG